MFRSGSQQKQPPEPATPRRTSRRRRSDLRYAIHSKREVPTELDLISMVRLSGKSLFHLPNEYSPCALILPTCLRAMAQNLAQNPSVNGLFRIPGSVKTVNSLVEYYCQLDEGKTEVTGTVRYASLPAHVQCSANEVSSAFKRLLSMLPGGILGSLSVFDAFVAIHSQLGTSIEITRTRQTKIKARLIALVVGSIESQYRRELICSVFGLLCMIGRHAETAPREDKDGKPLPTNDLMGYRALGIVFGPLLVGEWLDDYSTQLATLESGLVVLPAIANSKWGGGASMDKISIANEVAEMLISYWRDVVRQMKTLGVHRHRSSASGPKRATRHHSSHQYLKIYDTNENQVVQERSPTRSNQLSVDRKRPRRQPGKQQVDLAPRHGHRLRETNFNARPQNLKNGVFDIRREENPSPNKAKRLDTRRQRLERLKGGRLEGSGLQTQMSHDNKHVEKSLQEDYWERISGDFETSLYHHSRPNTTITRSKPREHLRPIALTAEKQGEETKGTRGLDSKIYQNQFDETPSKRSSVRTLAAMFENQNSPSPGQLSYKDHSIRPKRSNVSMMKSRDQNEVSPEHMSSRRKLSTPQHASGSRKPSPMQTRSGGTASRIPVTKTVRHTTSDSGPLFAKKMPNNHTEKNDLTSQRASTQQKKPITRPTRASCGCPRSIPPLQNSKDAPKVNMTGEASLPAEERAGAERGDDKLPELVALYIIIDRLYEVLQETTREADGLRTKLRTQVEVLEASQLEAAQTDSTYEELLQLRADVFRWRLKAENAEKKLTAFERFATKVHRIKEAAISSEDCSEDDSNSDVTITQQMGTRPEAEEPVYREPSEYRPHGKGRYDGVSSDDKDISSPTTIEDLGLTSEEDLDSMYGDVASLWQAARTLLETEDVRE